jgi:hypothetical protein
VRAERLDDELVLGSAFVALHGTDCRSRCAPARAPEGKVGRQERSGGREHVQSRELDLWSGQPTSRVLSWRGGAFSGRLSYVNSPGMQRHNRDRG